MSPAVTAEEFSQKRNHTVEMTSTNAAATKSTSASTSPQDSEEKDDGFTQVAGKSRKRAAPRAADGSTVAGARNEGKPPFVL